MNNKTAKPQKIVLATGNLNKVKEINAIVESIPVVVLPQSQFQIKEAVETGTTFIENAIIKARNASEQTGLPAIADDSGIEVDALNGEPGVYSSRYSGPDSNDQKNLEKLIENIKNVPEERRSCRYWCVMVYLKHAKDPTPVVCQASWEGQLITTPMGSNGFGYDPIFWIPSQKATAAQITLEQKNSMSHRAKALKMLFAHLQEIYC